MSTTDTDTKDDGRLHSKRSHKGTKSRRLDHSKLEHKMNGTARLLQTLHIITQMPGAVESASSDRDQMTFRASERGSHPETHDAGRDTVTGFQALRPRSGPLPEP
jgi:hypothetical protein